MKKRTNLTAVMLAICLMGGIFSGCAAPASSTAATSPAQATAPAESSASASTASTEPQNRLEDILARGYIEVVMEPYFAPNEFIDPSKTGNEQYVGSDIELAKYIADKLGVELRLIPLEFSAVLSSITEGKYDLAISGLAYTPTRAEAMNLSKGYYFSSGDKGHSLLIRAEDADTIKSADDLADKVVVAQSGSLQELFVNQQVPAYKEFKRVSAATDGFLMVQEGKADACATSIPTGELFIEANPSANLMILPDFRFVQDKDTMGTRIGMPLGEDELTAKINEIIDEVVDAGIYDQWYDEYSDYASNLGL